MAGGAPYIASFDAEKYWADKDSKKWVVTLERAARRHRATTIEIRRFQQTMYVQAKTRDSAITTAKANTYLDGKVICRSCRLANPHDLECKAK